MEEKKKLNSKGSRWDGPKQAYGYSKIINFPMPRSKDKKKMNLF